jgi:hypothetical protein
MRLALKLVGADVRRSALWERHAAKIVLEAEVQAGVDARRVRREREIDGRVQELRRRLSVPGNAVLDFSLRGVEKFDGVGCLVKEHDFLYLRGVDEVVAEGVGAYAWQIVHDHTSSGE